MKVKEIMTPDPYVVPGSTSIENIRQILNKYHIWSIYIGKSGKFDGIITKKDLESKSWHPYTPASKIMSRPVVSIDQDADVELAIKMLKEKKINQIAVTAAGKHCGIVTQLDINVRYYKINKTKNSSERKLNALESNNAKKFSVFISHINENKVVANKLKALILESFPQGVDVFVAGDPVNISFSDDWFEKIKAGIDECHQMIILCTPESVTRPWINFEAGAATILKKKVGPICFAGQKVGRLPSPLNYVRSQAIDCSDDESFEQYFKIFLERIAQHIGEPVPKIEIIKSEFYQEIKSTQIDRKLNKKEKDLSLEIQNRVHSEKELRVIQHMGQTIISPMQGLLESDREFFQRGYNIERFFLFQMIPNTNNHLPEQTPASLFKKIVHDPDPVLQKYYNEIEKLCSEYNIYSKRLADLNENIFERKDLIWKDFVNLCDHLNSGSLTIQQDYITILALIIADPKNLGNQYHMWDFFSSHRKELHAFIMESLLEKEVREFQILRNDFEKFSDHFLTVLTNLKTQWMKTYLFLEPDFQPVFERMG